MADWVHLSLNINGWMFNIRDAEAEIRSTVIRTAWSKPVRNALRCGGLTRISRWNFWFYSRCLQGRDEAMQVPQLVHYYG